MKEENAIIIKKEGNPLKIISLYLRIGALILLTIIVLSVIIIYLGKYIQPQSEIAQGAITIGILLIIISLVATAIYKKINVSFGRQAIVSLVIGLAGLFLVNLPNLGLAGLFFLPLLIGGGIWFVVSIVGYFLTRNKS